MNRLFLLMGCCLLLTRFADGATPTMTERFELRGQLQPMPPMHGNGRFSLGGRLTPAASRPSSADRFSQVAKLEPVRRGACTPEPEIFRNGFEAP